MKIEPFYIDLSKNDYTPGRQNYNCFQLSTSKRTKKGLKCRPD